MRGSSHWAPQILSRCLMMVTLLFLFAFWWKNSPALWFQWSTTTETKRSEAPIRTFSQIWASGTHATNIRKATDQFSIDENSLIDSLEVFITIKLQKNGSSQYKRVNTDVHKQPSLSRISLINKSRNPNYNLQDREERKKKQIKSFWFSEQVRKFPVREAYHVEKRTRGFISDSSHCEL